METEKIKKEITVEIADVLDTILFKYVDKIFVYNLPDEYTEKADRALDSVVDLFMDIITAKNAEK